MLRNELLSCQWKEAIVTSHCLEAITTYLKLKLSVEPRNLTVEVCQLAVEQKIEHLCHITKLCCKTRHPKHGNQ